MRWWMWVIAVVLLLFTAMVSIHLAGFARYRALQNELRSSGYPVTPVEFVALGPAVDADRQARLWPLVSWPGPKWQDAISQTKVRPPFNELSEQQPPLAVDLAKRDQALKDAVYDLDALSTILAEGPCVVSVYGWIERDPTRLATIDISQSEQSKTPNLLAVRSIVTALATRACLDTNPMPELRRLESFQRTLDHPGVLIDAMISISATKIRDDAILWLATRGRVGTETLLPWVAEPPLQLQWCADGYAGERCIWQEPFSRLNWGFSGVIGSDSAFLADMLAFLVEWPIQGYDLTVCSSRVAQVEAGLLGKPVPSGCNMPLGIPPLLTNIILPNLQECAVTAIEAATQHRLKRCAALISAAYRRDGILPATLPPEAQGLRVNDNIPALIYERLSPSRFRIGTDPSGLRPPLIPVVRWKPGYVSTIGSPPSSSKSNVVGRWSLEIDLDAILIPPPEKPVAIPKPPTTLPP